MKYFACKKFIARLPENKDMPSADALDLIVGKIYKQVRNGKREVPPIRKKKSRGNKL